MSEISELFARDPLSLSDTDIDTIIEHFRQYRANYIAGIKTPKVKKAVPEGGIKLEDLDLG